ncbi:uroporphyrinogen-III synthase [Phaeobacter sp. NW0010-22]|uniref:uroporphyrinogen-III synthase n=1 Tax=Phaeobacter sp. NW0010-22 TaxID=3135907 RepID=UPI00310601B1
MRLLMTRPRAASHRFVAQLSPELQETLEVICSPLLDIQPTGTAIDLTGVRGLIFTSSNGVNIAARQVEDRELPVFCVGAATTEMAHRAGWQATNAGETSEALIGALLQRRPESPLLHLRGEHVRGNIAQTLTQLGLSVRDQAIYDQRLLEFSPEARAALDGVAPVIAPLFSPRTARQFADLGAGNAPIWFAALSDAVAKPLETISFQDLRIAKRPESDAMCKTVEKLVKQVNRLEGQRGAL